MAATPSSPARSMAAVSIRCSTAPPKTPQATAWGEYLAEGAIAPMYMLRRGPWKFIHTPSDPDQLFNLDDDPDELNNLAASTSHRRRHAHAEVEAKFDIPRIHAEVLRKPAVTAS